MEPERDIGNPTKPIDMEFNKYEWMRIARSLDRHHVIFKQIWNLGIPLFTRGVPTAAVEFDENGDYIYFYFNPDLWDKLDHYNRCFIVAHECLHVILNHGVRIQDVIKEKKSGQAMICNIALDLVVNHMLTRGFGFDRNAITDWKNLCWIETLPAEVKAKANGLNDRWTFEAYYNLLKQHIKIIEIQVNGPSGGGSGGLKPVDDHSGLSDTKHTGVENKLKKIANSLSAKDKQKLLDETKQHGQQAGTEPSLGWLDVNTGRVKKKRKWEEVCKIFFKKKIWWTDYEMLQVQRVNRRFSNVMRNMPDMIIPTDFEVEDRKKEKKKIEIWLFLDVSGSCIHLVDRFVRAAKSFPEDKFEVKPFTFDTTVHKVDLKSGRIPGGGGTSFSIIEQYIQKDIGGNQKNYPKAVFIITDGMGDTVVPKFPERWYWFLSEPNGESYLNRLVPGNTNKFELAHFE